MDTADYLPAHGIDPVGQRAKWLTLALFAYVAIIFVIPVDWKAVGLSIVKPPKVMGQFAVTGWLRWLGWIATAAMGLAAIGMFWPT